MTEKKLNRQGGSVMTVKELIEQLSEFPDEALKTAGFKLPCRARKSKGGR